MKANPIPAAVPLHRASWPAIFSAILLIHPCLAGTQSAAANLVNGGFESGYTGWTVSGNQSIAAVAPYVATQGSKLVAFSNGNTAPNGVLSQSFATVPGSSYTVRFDMGILAYNNSEQRLQVDLNGSSPLVSQTFSISRLGSGVIRWLERSVSFTANSGTTVLTFRDRSTTSVSVDLLLDNVRFDLPVVRTLTMASSGVEAIPITVAPPDRNGAGDGVSTFSRSYDNGRIVNLTAPASVTTRLPLKGYAITNRFSRWLKDGANYDANRTTAITMDGDHVATAVFEPGAPIITSQPASATILVGGSVIFHVVVYSPETGYQWRFNGTNISGANSADYIINDVRADEAGTYDVVVRDIGGESISNPAVLTVKNASVGNASFESGFDGWSASGNVRVQSSIGPAPDGSKIVGFNAGNAAPNGVLSQVVATVPGITYLLSFDMGVLAYNTSEQRLQVDLAGNAMLASRIFSMTGIGGGNIRWETQSLSFTADSGTTVLTFRDKSTTSFSIDLLLDNIRLSVNRSGFTLIPGGTFVMGSNPGEIAHQPDELQHSVGISNAFYLKTTEVTWSEWNGVRNHAAAYGYTDIGTGQNGYAGDLSGTHPVTMVTWWDVIKWCNLRSEVEGRLPVYYTAAGFGGGSVLRTGTPAVFADWGAEGYRLPTESEWEYACRAGTITAFYTGPCTNPSGVDPNLELAGWYDKNSGLKTQPVGQKQPNAWNLWDMHGNVLEWCWDFYGSYPATIQVDPRGPDSGPFGRIYRGGDWAFPAYFSRAAMRLGQFPFNSYNNVGFRPARNTAPVDFSLVPAGIFRMGDTFGESGVAREFPVHDVRLDAFYMAKHEVTKALWDDVRAWGIAHGYADLPTGGGKGPDHPVHSVSWHSMVKWCNARSEREGLMPCYKGSGSIYRTGILTPDCDWSAGGYRLPTEAEWEKAARGGFDGFRFPFGNFINHYGANYFASNYSYELIQGSDLGYHPAYTAGGEPYTAPVGSFDVNGYGLSEMYGNVAEWCWDWYAESYYTSSPANDPRGPASGSDRVVRGGGWSSLAFYLRNSNRNTLFPEYSIDNALGFRLARNVVP
ncbi:MAG: SUMF1/EgtB/PvdO family nonheme iron enzyme [Luteolibacter sp.]